ncbi:hypothetical protein J6590_003078 [Homalodisca vitripennis]|nr:hypothetical protein J6590_003078 [Homalodisca vitripennis]
MCPKHRCACQLQWQLYCYVTSIHSRSVLEKVINTTIEYYSSVDLHVSKTPLCLSAAMTAVLLRQLHPLTLSLREGYQYNDRVLQFSGLTLSKTPLCLSAAMTAVLLRQLHPLTLSLREGYQYNDRVLQFRGLTCVQNTGVPVSCNDSCTVTSIHSRSVLEKVINTTIEYYSSGDLHVSKTLLCLSAAMAAVLLRHLHPLTLSLREGYQYNDRVLQFSKLTCVQNTAVPVSCNDSCTVTSAPSTHAQS